VAEAEQRGSGGDKGRRSRQESEGFVCNLRKFQGLLCKENFPLIQNPSEKNV
jgi:hypothetical protein